MRFLIVLLSTLAVVYALPNRPANVLEELQYAVRQIAALFTSKRPPAMLLSLEPVPERDFEELRRVYYENKELYEDAVKAFRMYNKFIESKGRNARDVSSAELEGTQDYDSAIFDPATIKIFKKLEKLGMKKKDLKKLVGVTADLQKFFGKRQNIYDPAQCLDSDSEMDATLEEKDESKELQGLSEDWKQCFEAMIKTMFTCLTDTNCYLKALADFFVCLTKK